MADPVRPSLFTIPIGIDISTALAGYLLDRFGDDRQALADTILLLPNNRAINALTAAFVRQADNGLLLPRMAAIGDLALDEALGPLLDPLGGSSGDALLPAIGDMERQLLLVRLVRKQRSDATPAEALHLARLLAETLDQLDVEGKMVSDIRFDADNQDLARHWQASYADLIAISEGYQAELRKRGELNPAERRNRLLGQLAARLKTEASDRLIIAAGISTAAPAIAGLMKQVAQLRSGMVLLPHVDLAMAEADWEALGPHGAPEPGERSKPSQESHPQFHLKLLLDRMGVRREEVSEFVTRGAKAYHARLTMAVADIFCPATQTTGWQELPQARKRLNHVRLMECTDSAEEARAISVLVREALETPQKRIALITPDREIALRVSAQLRRWGIHADDSAGESLVQQPAGVLLLAIAQMLAGQVEPVALLAVMKHPLVMAGERRLAWLERVRQLDLALRGPRIGLGLAGIGEAVACWDKSDGKADPLGPWWDSVAKRIGLAPMGFVALLASTERLADDLSEGVIWKGAASRRLAEFLEELHGQDLSALEGSDDMAFPALLDALMSGIQIRPAFGSHPRVSIYGLLEARLQTADMVICAGLNEGSWPQLPQPDPWLAPHLRRELEMPGLDRNIGLSAHDLGAALGAQEVVLTRSKRDRAGPTVASRFLLRMQALFGDNLAIEKRAPILAQRLDEAQAEAKAYKRPAPEPSREQRSVDISITQMDMLNADPFAFYARNILGLKVLKPVDADPDAAWKGTMVHDLLDLWAKEDGCDPDLLVKRAGAMLRNPALHPSLRMFWQPRISAGLRWIAGETRRLHDEEKREIVATETKGKVEIDGVLVHGRIDRIDQLQDGRLVVVDYKTGSPPKKKQVNAGYALQLGLAGLMAETGGIEKVTGEVAAFEYWSLARSKAGEKSFGYYASPFSNKPGERLPTSETFVSFADDAARAAIGRWILSSEPFTAKLKPDYAIYKDYDQLMRLPEWIGQTSWQEADADE